MKGGRLHDRIGVQRHKHETNFGEYRQGLDRESIYEDLFLCFFIPYITKS